MKNIHILPTDKPSRLIFDKEENRLLPLQDEPVFMEHQNLVENQCIYITSDEEIKEGDWFINVHINSDYIDKRAPKASHRYAMNSNAVFSNPKKIILTTDPELIKDGVQAIDDEFLEWFVNNANESGVPFDRCEVEEVYPLICCIQKEGKTKMNNGCMERNRCLNYKIIIPKEEPKQETLEEAAEKYANELPEPYNYGINSDKKKGFIEGAKWMQERSYSEEEVLDILRKSHSIEKTSKMDSWITKWFEQFKKEDKQ